MKLRELIIMSEDASPGATASADIATVAYPLFVRGKTTKQKRKNARAAVGQAYAPGPKGIGTGVFEGSREQVDPNTVWEVSFDYGPHQSDRVKVRASSQEEAEQKGMRAAKKLGHRFPQLNWAMPVEQGVAEGATGVSVRGWANQVRREHGDDVKFFNRKEGGGAVDSVVARNSQGETVGVYNRKTGYPTVFEPKQGVAEGAPIVVMPSVKRLEKKHEPSLSRGMDPAKAQGEQDARDGKPYNNPYPFKKELGAPGNWEHNLYRASYNSVKNGKINEYGDTAKGQKMLTKVQKRAVDRVVSKKADTDPKYAKKNQDTANAAWERMSGVDEAHVLNHDNVIYRLDRENPMSDTEVAVLGGAGRYSLKALRDKARREAGELAQDLSVEHGGAFRRSAENIKQLTNTINTIVAAYNELARLRRKGGRGSRGITDEDANFIRECIRVVEQATQNYRLMEGLTQEPDPQGYAKDTLTNPKYTIVVNTPGDLDWYKIGTYWNNKIIDPHEFGQDDSDTVLVAQSAEEYKEMLARIKQMGLTYKTIGGTTDQPEIHDKA